VQLSLVLFKTIEAKRPRNLICDITAGTARKSKEENTNDYQNFFLFHGLPKINFIDGYLYVPIIIIMSKSSYMDGQDSRFFIYQS
jgi:hypothetical protein